MRITPKATAKVSEAPLSDSELDNGDYRDECHMSDVDSSEESLLAMSVSQRQVSLV